MRNSSQVIFSKQPTGHVWATDINVWRQKLTKENKVYKVDTLFFVVLDSFPITDNKRWKNVVFMQAATHQNRMDKITICTNGVK